MIEASSQPTPDLGEVEPATLAGARKVYCPLCGDTVLRDRQPAPQRGENIFAECVYCEFHQVAHVLADGSVHDGIHPSSRRAMRQARKPGTGEYVRPMAKRPKCLAGGCVCQASEGGLCEGHHTMWRIACQQAGQRIEVGDWLATSGLTRRPAAKATAKPTPMARSRRKPVRTAPRRAPRVDGMGVRVCDVANCGRRHLAKGMCGTHYNRWLVAGRPADVGNFVGQQSQLDQ